MMDMIEILDRLACWWIDWRMDRDAKSNPAVREMGLKKIGTFPGGWEVTFVSPAVAMIADEMAAMLDKANAKNYISFDFIPRLDRGRQPVRVTVEWAHGESPATKAAAGLKHIDSLVFWMRDLLKLSRELSKDLKRLYEPGYEYPPHIQALEGSTDFDTVLNDADQFLGRSKL
jgi:hypothetical protein